jgi:hypothetical protein
MMDDEVEEDEDYKYRRVHGGKDRYRKYWYQHRSIM